jgi:hypothetical protein
VLSLLDELAANIDNTYRDVVAWCVELDQADEADTRLQGSVKEAVEKLEDLAAVV